MAAKLATTTKGKADATLSKQIETKTSEINFTIHVDGETINTNNTGIMVKLAEAATYLETVEDQDGQLIISRKRAKHMRTWEKILKSHNDGTILEGRIKRKNKGGFVVDIDGIESYCPMMLLSAEEKMTKEKTMALKIVHVSPAQNCLVVASGKLSKAEVNAIVPMLNMREIISLHIGQA